jgi:hypothetical protein
VTCFTYDHSLVLFSMGRSRKKLAVRGRGRDTSFACLISYFTYVQKKIRFAGALSWFLILAILSLWLPNGYENRLEVRSRTMKTCGKNFLETRNSHRKVTEMILREKSDKRNKPQRQNNQYLGEMGGKWATLHKRSMKHQLAADPAVRSSVLVAVILACLIFLCLEKL